MIYCNLCFTFVVYISVINNNLNNNNPWTRGNVQKVEVPASIMFYTPASVSNKERLLIAATALLGHKVVLLHDEANRYAFRSEVTEKWHTIAFRYLNENAGLGLVDAPMI